MKYSELKAKVEELGFKVDSTLYSRDIVITSSDAKPPYLARLSTEVEGCLCTDYIGFKELDRDVRAKLLKSLTTLSLTPLKDRKELKLYHLWSQKPTGSVYLYLKTSHGKGITTSIYDNYNYFVNHHPDSAEADRFLFSDEEIDALPDYLSPRSNRFMYMEEVKGVGK